MKVETTYCDICGRSFGEVQESNPEATGHSSLLFKWTIGSHGGGTGKIEKYDDICRDCTEAILLSLETKINILKKEQIKVINPTGDCHL